MVKAGRVGVAPTEVDHYGRIITNGYYGGHARLPDEILESDSGTLSLGQYIDVGLAYKDFTESPIPYVAMFLDETDLTIIPAHVVMIKPDEVNQPNGRIIYLCYKNGETAPKYLILDTTTEDTTHTTAWQWSNAE